MKSLVLALAAAATLSPAAASANQQAACDQAQIAELKEQILSIARANNGRRDNLPEVRAQLDPLVAQLASTRAPVTAEQDLPVTVGAWKEIWSDDVEPEPPGFVLDRDTVYQIVTPFGYFYNVAERVSPQGQRATGLLRGQYSSMDEYLGIEFTAVGVRFAPLGDAVLYDLALGFENGTEPYLVPPGDNAPPVGARGRIRNLYIDQEIRIATGRNLADGRDDLYVLVRTERPFRVAANR
jgi:hypothetical protein